MFSWSEPKLEGAINEFRRSKATYTLFFYWPKIILDGPNFFWTVKTFFGLDQELVSRAWEMCKQIGSGKIELLCL